MKGKLIIEVIVQGPHDATLPLYSKLSSSSWREDRYPVLEQKDISEEDAAKLAAKWRQENSKVGPHSVTWIGPRLL